MSIQYAGGTIVNYVFNSDGTRPSMQSTLVTQLANAGWSTLSGGGTSDTVMKSAVTPQGLSISVEIKDPGGSNNCIQITMRTALGDKISQIAYMLPTNGRQFRLIANKYQWWFFSTGGGNSQNAREVVMMGVPYVPPFILSTLGNLETGWFIFTGSTDTATGAQNTWRSQTFLNEGSTFYSTLWSATLWNGPSNFGGPVVPTCPSGWNLSGTVGLTWKDGSYVVDDSLVGWNDSSNSQAITWRGQLWDAISILTSYSGETTVPWDSGTFMAITHNNPRGTLFVKVA